MERLAQERGVELERMEQCLGDARVELRIARDENHRLQGILEFERDESNRESSKRREENIN